MKEKKADWFITKKNVQDFLFWGFVLFLTVFGIFYWTSCLFLGYCFATSCEQPQEEQKQSSFEKWKDFAIQQDATRHFCNEEGKVFWCVGGDGWTHCKCYNSMAVVLELCMDNPNQCEKLLGDLKNERTTR